MMNILKFMKVKNSFINMTVLYIMVGIVFVLITAMNIYAYRVIAGMGDAYASLGTLSKQFRAEFQEASDNLSDIIEKRQDKDLKDAVYTHLEKAQKSAMRLKKIQPKLNLEPNLDKFEKTAREAYSKQDRAEKKQALTVCQREVGNAIAKLDASEEERSQLIKNETGFIGFIYTVLLIGNCIAFGGIFFVVFVNEHNFKAKENKLNTVNANFHAVMQGLDSILITINNSGVIQSWNGNAVRYFELQESEAVGKNIYELTPVFQQFKAFFDTVFYSLKRQYKYHERMHVNKGPTRIVDILCVPMVSASGKKELTELLIKMDDVTSFTTEEEHHIRERCTQLVCTGMEDVVKDSASLNAQAGETLRALNEMAASHGLAEEMTPYTAYLNNSLAQISMVPQKYASTLHTGALNKIQIDLNEMVMYALRVCLKTFPSCINIEVSLNESKSWILADPIALSRTFFCLMNNAAEAITEMRPKGQEGGIISVSVEKIAGDKIVCDKIMRFRHAVKEPPYWVVLISDNGVGIPQDVQPSIYDPFFTTKNPDIHKGLGLSVAINVINELNGFMDVNSSVGRGSVFKIYIPELPGGADSAETAVSANLNADDSQIEYGQGTVLFVNDDIFMRKITRKLLEKFGYTVIETDNGFGALDIYANDMNTNTRAIQCVLVNINTGYFRNTDIVSNLKQMDPDARAIVMVNSESDEDADRLRELGITDFVKKPYSIPQLSRLLRKNTAGEEVQA